jgi:hypothetical protein
MRPKTTSEKIDFLVRNWIDGADVETIIEYAAEQLGKFYIDLGADLVDKLYLDELEEQARQELAATAADEFEKRKRWESSNA